MEAFFLKSPRFSHRSFSVDRWEFWRHLGGGNSKICYFHPYLGKIPILTSIFFKWVDMFWDSVLWFQICLFSPRKLGKWSKLTNIFLKPSSRKAKRFSQGTQVLPCLTTWMIPRICGTSHFKKKTRWFNFSKSCRCCQWWLLPPECWQSYPARTETARKKWWWLCLHSLKRTYHQKDGQFQ